MNWGGASWDTLPKMLLRALSLDPSLVPSEAVVDGEQNRWNSINALATLRREFPNFDAIVVGKCVLDYGCGDGFQSCALAQLGAKYVLGVDIQEERLARARARARGLMNVDFARVAPRSEYDIAISLNAFEHYDMPEQTLADIKASIKPGGLLLVTFGPPWYAPYGGHMRFFTKVPWVHLLFPEKSVFEVRRLYRDDGMRSYSPGMNKMSVRRFEDMVRESGLIVEWRVYHAIKGIAVLSKISVVRELFISQVTYMLRSA